MNDLYNLGVRVSALEDRVGNVKFTGDARINYVEKEGIDNLDSEGKFAARVRLNMDAKVNKNTSVKHMVDIGRYTQSFGDGLIYSSNFDGIGYTTQVGKLKVNAAYGYPTLGRFSKASKDNNSEMSLATNAEWVTATGLSNSDVWNVGVKWGDYKITKKNSWRVALDYYNQEKNAPVFKTQKYEGN